jgi:hypothetical protein
MAMPEVSPPRALDPAARTTAPSTQNTPNKTAVLTDFRSLLMGASSKQIPAHRPGSASRHLIAPQTTPERAPAHPLGTVRRRSERELDPDSTPAREAALDPLSCQLACHAVFQHALTPVVIQTPGPVLAPAALPPSADLQQLLTGLARRVAWGGDRRKGTARIELSEGALAGATLIVHTEQRSVTVELELPAGAGAGTQGWEARLTERLEGRGFSARVRVA